MKRLILVTTLCILFLVACAPNEAQLREQHAEAAQAEAAAAKSWLEVEIDKAAMPAIIAERIQQARTREAAFTIAVLSLTAAISILAISGSIGTGRYVLNRLSSVYADQRGIFPLQIKQGKTVTGEAFVIVHDANRQLGPTTIYQIGNSSPQQTEKLPEDPRALLEVTTNAQRAATVAAVAPHVAGRMNADVLPGVRIVGAPVNTLPDVTKSSLETSHVKRLLADVLDEDEEGG
jgi:hypothetical protein